MNNLDKLTKLNKLQKLKRLALKKKKLKKKNQIKSKKLRKAIKRNKLWGELKDKSNLRKDLRLSQICPNNKDLQECTEISALIKEEPKEKIITIDNPLVTQTIEVMNQTEMIQGLLDTYTTNNSYNRYVLNTCQVMPNIDLPLDTTADLVKNEKFAKPIWHIPPNYTKFTNGTSNNVTKLSKPVILQVIRKSLAGMLRLKSFNECTESSLVMFVDAVDEFFKCFMESINLTLLNEYKDRHRELNVEILEKAYFSMTNSSLTSLHNYYKHEVLLRNKSEIKVFKDIFQEYDKLKQESQNMQKYQKDDFLGILDYAGTTSAAVYTDGNINVMNFLNTDNNISTPTGFDPNATIKIENSDLQAGPSKIEN